MAQYIEFPTENGDTILIEVEEVKAPGIRKVGISPEELIERADKTFEQALSSLRLRAHLRLYNILNRCQPPPHALEISLGVSEG